MSYPLDLDEIPSRLLAEELERRFLRVDRGHCPYCNAPVTGDPEAAACQCREGKRLKDYHNRAEVLRLLRFLK